jgi:hypothetical protein
VDKIEGVFSAKQASSELAGELVEILVEGEGLASAEIIAVTRGSSLREVIEIAARQGGYAHQEALIFLEGDGTPLDPATLLTDAHPHHRKHHVHRLREIEVVVLYTRNVERRYPPSTKVETVLAWAVKELGIDPAMATEFELAVVGSDVEVPGAKHIGSLVKHPACRIDFNLIRGVIPNGSLQ